MVSPTDLDYKSTKPLKNGKQSLSKPYKDLADWIQRKYEVRVLNIRYDKIKQNNRPRLNIILDETGDSVRFRTSDHLGNFDTKKQKAVWKEFEKILHTQNNEKFHTENLLVVFSDFETVAKYEANSKVTPRDITKLKQDLGLKNLWEVSQTEFGTVFFFFTEAQAQLYRRKEAYQILLERTFKMIKKYDEFDYFQLKSFEIRIDSEENFKKTYKSSWFNYYR